MSHLLKAGLLVLALLLARPGDASAFDWREFANSVACSRLPMLACELLDPETARNIGTINVIAHANRLCGKPTVHPHEMRFAADEGLAPEPHACRHLANDVERRQRGAALQNPAPAPQRAPVNPPPAPAMQPPANVIPGPMVPPAPGTPGPHVRPWGNTPTQAPSPTPLPPANQTVPPASAQPMPPLLGQSPRQQSDITGTPSNPGPGGIRIEVTPDRSRADLSDVRDRVLNMQKD
jgi:hypothetical protein